MDAIVAKGDREQPKGTPDDRPDDAPAHDDPGGVAIVCASCGHRITTTAARTEVNGQHRHVCVNPSGIPFDIACWSSAPGCVPQGAAESYWSWFTGYAWRIALCGGCHRHLGWSFERGDVGFHGLIAARVLEAEQDSS